jgi:hypothetical protein
MDGAGEFLVEGGAASVSAVISSCSSSSSAESLRTMTLPSPGSPRSSWLSSPKSLQAISSAHMMSGKISSSSKERSTTGITSEGPSCSRIGEGGLCGNASGDDTSGGTESDGDGYGVQATLEDEEEPLAEEREHLMPLFFSIAHK